MKRCMETGLPCRHEHRLLAVPPGYFLSVDRARYMWHASANVCCLQSSMHTRVEMLTAGVAIRNGRVRKGESESRNAGYKSL